MDWFKYQRFFTPFINIVTYALNEDDVTGFNKESYDREYNGKFEFEDDSIIDVTDSYKELETISSICNRCEHQHLAIRINDKTQQTLCDAWDYKKPIDGSKTQCNKFKLRKGLEDRLLNG